MFDAWDVGLGNPDNVPKAKTRIAWTEEAMFSKAVLCRDKRNLKKQQAYAAAKNRLDRWEQGERKTLWEWIHVPKQQKKKKAASEEQRIQRVNNLAQKGKAGKAIQAATSPGLAMDTQDVEDMLTSKFPRRLQENRNRPIPPFQHQATREEVVKEIRSFGQGATPGHLGLWPQFLKEMVGAEGDQDIINVYVERVQVFLDGRAPAYMRQWYGGGRLVGIGKDDEPLDKDARPLVVGETWRRLVEKVGLRGEGIQNPESDFVGFLKKYQVAIGVKAGSEVIIHTLRQWCLRNKGASGIALLKRDYANAFNTADEHELLTACHEWLPGCARFAEWCYGETVNLIYHGRILHSHKGQQGSPLMMPMFCAMRQKMRKETPSVRNLSIVADYADDGMDGGSLQQIWDTLQEEYLIADKYGLQFNYKKMTLYLMDGESSQDPQDPQVQSLLQRFREKGIAIDTSMNIMFMKVPLIGSPSFVKGWVERKLQALRGTWMLLKSCPTRMLHITCYAKQLVCAGSCFGCGQCRKIWWGSCCKSLTVCSVELLKS